VSGIDTVVPSNSFTLRPRQRHARGMRASSRVPTLWHKRSGIARGKRCRAWQ